MKTAFFSRESIQIGDEKYPNPNIMEAEFEFEINRNIYLGQVFGERGRLKAKRIMWKTKENVTCIFTTEGNEEYEVVVIGDLI